MKAENVLLEYGGPGVGKTTLLAQIAADVHKRYGLKSRIISADGGGDKAFVPLKRAGIVDFWPIDQWDEASCFYTLKQAAKGWWPESVDEPNSPLVPPTAVVRPCSKCLGDSGASGLSMVAVCKSCGHKFASGEVLKRETRAINGMESVGFVGFEGLTAFGNMLMSRLKIADPTGGRSIKDEGTTISASGQQHYGDAQSTLEEMVRSSKNIPVKVVAWTALEIRGGDDFGKPVFGPKLPGKALTETCIAWFTDVMHVDQQPRLQGTSEARDKDGIPILDRKIYLAKHYPADAKPYGFAAKSSPPLEGGMPVVLDFAAEGNTMTRFFDELEKAYQKAQEKVLGTKGA